MKKVCAAKMTPGIAQTRSPLYRMAYTDEAFLLRDELPTVWLQLELLNPDLIHQEREIYLMKHFL